MSGQGENPKKITMALIQPRPIVAENPLVRFAAMPDRKPAALRAIAVIDQMYAYYRVEDPLQP